MPEFDGLSTFRKSGYQRLRDAEHLLDPPTADVQESGVSTRHTRGAMYLCGYGVECLLKAYLIAQYPPLHRLSDVLLGLRKADPDVRDICGVAGHNLAYLLTLTRLEERMDSPHKEQMRLCKKWRSNWRYSSVPADRDSAKAMVQAARATVVWINPQI